MAAAVHPRNLIPRAFRVLGELRHRRVFHPDGVLFDGELTARPGVLPLPAGTHRVVGRMSKGAGTPGGLPDILGLAFRLGGQDGDRLWDILLASSAPGAVGQLLLLPQRAWRGSTYSSVLPYRVDDRRPVWLLAEADDGQPAGTTALDALAEHARRQPLRFALSEASVAGERRTVGELKLRGVRRDSSEPSFDPVVHHPPGVRLWPDWVGKLRELSYRGSRVGRKSA